MIEYDKVFNKDDKTGGVRSEIMTLNPNLAITLNSLILGGTHVEQLTLDGDGVIYANPEKPYKPEYKHPKMLRLERPTILHNGVTRTVTVDNLDRALEVVNIEGIKEGVSSLSTRIV